MNNKKCITMCLTASAQSEDGQKGLNFIANWIEIVIARLHVSITNLDVLVLSHSSSSSIHARLSLRDIRFFNSAEFSSGKSVSDSVLLSESLTFNTSPSSSKMTILNLSAKKSVLIASLRLELCRPATSETPTTTTTTNTTTTTTVLSFEQELRVNVKMDRKIADVSEGMDVDVSVPECVFHITAADVKDISVLLFAYDILKKDGAHVNADVCTLYLIHSLSYVCMYVSYVWSQFIYPSTIYTHEYISYTGWDHPISILHSRNMNLSGFVYIQQWPRSSKLSTLHNSTIFTHEEDLSAFKTLSLCMYVCMYV